MGLPIAVHMLHIADWVRDKAAGPQRQAMSLHDSFRWAIHLGPAQNTVWHQRAVSKHTIGAAEHFNFTCFKLGQA